MIQQLRSPPPFLKGIPDYGYGVAPAYLTGQLAWYQGIGSWLLITPSYNGPILVRGSRIDRPATVPATDTAIQPVAIPANTGPPQWRFPGIGVMPAAGCYELQLDGANFTEHIVFQVLPGPAPRG